VQVLLKGIATCRSFVTRGLRLAPDFSDTSAPWAKKLC